MTKKTMYYFDTMSSTGINDVPLNTLVQVLQGPNGAVYFTLLDKSNLTDTSTIDDVFADDTQYRNFAIKQLITYDYDANTINFEL